MIKGQRPQRMPNEMRKQMTQRNATQIKPSKQSRSLIYPLHATHNLTSQPYFNPSIDKAKKNEEKAPDKRRKNAKKS